MIFQKSSDNCEPKMAFGQRELMKRLFAEFGGDKEAVILAYTLADERGEVRRSRNQSSTSSREYAVRLWANGIYQGWLSVEDTPKVRRSVSAPKPRISDSNPAFEEGLIQLAQSWFNDPSRPVLTIQDRSYWKELILEWCEDPTMPLPVRKTGNRGFLLDHPEGRGYFLCDNSPAHWAFRGCYQHFRPSLEEVRRQIEHGKFPVKMAPTRDESKLKLEGALQYGGMSGGSEYGKMNPFLDGRSYKLCHLDSVGLGSRGEVASFTIQDLKRHVMKLLDPSNMILVPLQYGGVGECKAFLDVFRAASEIL